MNKNTMNKPNTNKYFKQKKPSFITIDTLERHNMKISIKPKRLRKLREILYIVDGPMH